MICSFFDVVPGSHRGAPAKFAGLVVAAGGKENRWETLTSSHALLIWKLASAVLALPLRFALAGRSPRSFGGHGRPPQDDTRELVRNHPFDPALIGVAHQDLVAELALALGALRSQDVAQVRMTALHFPGGGFL